MAGAAQRVPQTQEEADETRRLLDALTAKVSPTVLAGQQIMPVSVGCRDLFPEGGLRRGSTVAVTSPSLAFAIVAQASQTGSWLCAIECGGTGTASGALGWVSAAEYGVALERVVVVRVAGDRARVAGDGARVAGDGVPAVVSAALDAFDVVLVSDVVLAPRDVRRLHHRARERNAVLMAVERVSSLAGLGAGADVRLEFSQQQWHGVGQGYGALERRSVTVSVQGRRAAARPRDVVVWLPNTDGSLHSDSLGQPGSLAQVGSLGWAG